MREKEKEILEAIAPENQAIKRKSRRLGRRLGLFGYTSAPTIATPFTLRIPSK